jgi:hypothetical protein
MKALCRAISATLLVIPFTSETRILVAIAQEQYYVHLTGKMQKSDSIKTPIQGF